jgi:hypothetical protein
MAQGADGNWYGYFGDSTTVAAADTASNNLDFGVDETPLQIGAAGFEAGNVFINATAGTIKNPPALSNWNNTISGESVGPLNAAAAILADASYGIGQIGILDNETSETDEGTNHDQWPMIQLYDLTIETFDVVYEQAGADEVVTLNFVSSDMDDYAGLELDRNSASAESEIHLTITDNQLNIDPTAKDVVIF